MTWLVSIHASCWRCWMKRSLNRSLGLQPSGKVTELMLEKYSGIFFLEVHESFVFWSCPVDFRRRFLSLLSYQFSTFSPSLALNILQNKNIKQQSQPRKYPGSHTHLECNLKSLCRFIRVLKHMHGVMPLVRCDELFLVFCFHHPKNKKKLVFLSKN